MVARGFTAPMHASCIDMALEFGCRLNIPRAPAHGLVLTHSQLRSPGLNCGPYQALHSILNNSNVINSMSGFFNDDILPSIVSAYSTDENLWGVFEQDMDRAASSADWTRLAKLWEELEPLALRNRVERRSRHRNHNELMYDESN